MSDNILTFSLTVFTGFFAIMNPIANTPVFLGLVGDKDKKKRESIAKTSCITAFLIVVFFVILGKYLFELFGIFHFKDSPDQIHRRGLIQRLLAVS